MGEIGAGGGSSFPTSLDTESTVEVDSPNAGKTLARAAVPNDLAAAVVAIETNIGTAAQGTKTDIKTYLQVDHGTDGVEKLSKRYMLDTGAADAYAIAPTPAITAYTAGMMFSFNAVFANTTASTLNVNALGVKSIKKAHDQALVSGDIEAGQVVTVIYDGTNFQMQSQTGTMMAPASLLSGTIATGVVIPIARIDGYTTSFGFDFGSIAAGDSTHQAVTVTGAAVNDYVLVSCDAPLGAMIVYHGFVASANTVWVNLSNVGTVAQDPGNQTYYVKVIKH